MAFERTKVEEITFEEIEELLEDTYYLTYIDYRSSLEGYEKAVQASIHQHDYQPIYEKMNDWLTDSEWYGLDYAFKQLRKALLHKYNLLPSEVDELIEKYRDKLQYEIRSRDKSTPISDLIHNTGPVPAFYDIGHRMMPNSWSWDDEAIEEEIGKLKTVLQITSAKHDDALEELVTHATYGGRTVIYFLPDLKKMTSYQKHKEHKTIVFSGSPAVAIIDTHKGSGWHVYLPGHEITLPYDPKSVFIDKVIKYNYTYKVCGLASDWCGCTDVTFTDEVQDTELPESTLHAELEQEARYQKVFDEGGCTFGDMDINRHRNVYYRNSFPCGMKCKDCGTFWID